MERLKGNKNQIIIVGNLAIAKCIDNVVQELQQGFLRGRLCGKPNQGSNRRSLSRFAGGSQRGLSPSIDQSEAFKVGPPLFKVRPAR